MTAGRMRCVRSPRVTLAAIAVVLAGCAAEVSGASAPILGGAPATEAQLHGTVLVLLDDRPICTGTLIEPDVVVTAAHCVAETDFRGFPDWRVIEVYDDSRLAVVAGALDAASALPEQTYAVGQTFRVATYPYLDVMDTPSSVGRLDDLGLLILWDDVRQLEPVPRLPFDRVDEVLAPGATVVITGYGQDEAGTAGTLRWAETTVETRSNEEVLAGGVGVPDSCFGDSGGPGYVELDGVMHLFGVTSRGRNDTATLCGDGGIYTLVSAYETWIDDRTATPVAGGCNAAPAPGSIPPLAALLGPLALVARRRRS